LRPTEGDATYSIEPSRIIPIDASTFRDLLLPMLALPAVTIFGARFGVRSALLASATFLLGLFAGAYRTAFWELSTLSSVADVAAAVATVVGVWVAIDGIQGWKREMHGRADYELAKRILPFVYQMRDGVKVVRRPEIWVAEKTDRPARAIDARVECRTGRTREELESAEDTAFAYQKRWESISQPGAELHAALFEAQALWGDLLVGARASLSRAINELDFALSDHLLAKKNKHHAGTISPERNQQIDSLLYAPLRPGPGDDPFAEKLDAAVKQFEDALRPKLQRETFQAGRALEGWRRGRR
jgi:hypothetical protein